MVSLKRLDEPGFIFGKDVNFVFTFASRPVLGHAQLLIQSVKRVPDINLLVLKVSDDRC
jgi:hypothetical protein